MDGWVRQWQGAMLRFARLHLSSHEDAEDAVQDTFAAALVADPLTLSGVDPRSYLFGILRHKVMDRLRRRYRAEVTTAQPEDDLDALLFDGRGHWLGDVAPKAWVTPEAQLESDQFFRVVDACVNHLPAKPARVFSMKEFLECGAEEICEALGITRADYWQCLSRARKQIHLCLNQNWFGGGTLR
ncbi:MAG: sigma-70 family RNA polymerase sigma factor [Pseudomonadota bacterium]